MWEALEVLRRVHRGEAQRSVARGTGHSRNTVKRYVETALELGWEPGAAEPGESLAAEVMARMKPGPRRRAAAGVEALLLAQEGKLKEWLCPGDSCGRGIKLTKVLQLLRREGVDVSYPSLRRFAVKRLDYGKGDLTVRMADVRPGEVAEVDFGKLGLVYDQDAGRERMVFALVVTLVYSRHQYVYLSHSQRTCDFIGGLEEAWSFFGGVPARVVIDNLKPAVKRPDRYEPFFQRTFAEYARHRGFVIDAAVPGEPKGKPHVERQVPYVRENFFRGEKFLSMEHAQREASRWCVETAGTRVHGTTRRRPLEVFEAEERHTLRPLQEGRFDPPEWAEVKVHRDRHIQFMNALYSVPDPHVGKTVTVKAQGGLVRVYAEGRLVKTHQMQRPGGRSTDLADYPGEKAPYAGRDAAGVVARAKECGESVGQMAEKLLEGDFPWARLRQVQKLFRLAGRYGDSRVDAACRRALAFDLVSVPRVEKIILGWTGEGGAGGSSGPAMPGSKGMVLPFPAKYLRGTDSFRHPSPEEG
jgi:transposase